LKPWPINVQSACREKNKTKHIGHLTVSQCPNERLTAKELS